MNRSEFVKLLQDNSIPAFRMNVNSKIPFGGGKGVYAATLNYDEKFFVGFNIGLATGHGIIVVDVDPRNKGHETVASWKIGGYELPETFTVNTPSGGYHKYYRSHTIKNTKFEGIEVQSKGKYVLGPTSKAYNKYYIAEEDCLDITDAPKWLEDFCKREEKKLVERIESESTTMEDLEFILGNIDPDLDYEDWIKVGFAINSKDSSDEGFNTWIKFSRGDYYGRPAAKFSEDIIPSMVKRWSDFEADGGITIGTLFYMASEQSDDLFSELKTSPKKEMKPNKSIIIIDSEPVVTKQNANEIPVPRTGLLADLYQDVLKGAYEQVPVFALGTAISIISAITQRAYIVNNSIRTRSYNLLLGRAGSGKNDYLEISKAYIKDSIKHSGNVQLLTETPRSGQSILQILKEYPQRFLVIDEWTDTIERAYQQRRDASAHEIMTELKTLWGNVVEYQGSRKRDSKIKSVDQPRLTILGAGVPSKILNLLENPEFITDGLMSRIEIWYCDENRPIKFVENKLKFEPNPDLTKQLSLIFSKTTTNGTNIQEGCGIVSTPGLFNLQYSEDAKTLIRSEVARINSINYEEGVRSILGRLFERLQMYAGLHAIGRFSTTVSESDVGDFAIPLFRYHLAQYLKWLQRQRDSEFIKDLSKILQHVPSDRHIKMRELISRSRTFQRLFNKPQDKIAYLQSISEMGYIEFDQVKNSVRLLTSPKL